MTCAVGNLEYTYVAKNYFLPDQLQAQTMPLRVSYGAVLS